MLFLCIQSFDNFITNKTLAVSDYRVQRLFLLSKIEEKMDMVRHYRIAQEFVAALVQNFEKFVNLVIGICELNEMDPLEAGKRDKVNAWFFYYNMDRHTGKIRTVDEGQMLISAGILIFFR